MTVWTGKIIRTAIMLSIRTMEFLQF